MVKAVSGIYVTYISDAGYVRTYVDRLWTDLASDTLLQNMISRSSAICVRETPTAIGDGQWRDARVYLASVVGTDLSEVMASPAAGTGS